jgi:hypothetical protein
MSARGKVAGLPPFRQSWNHWTIGRRPKTTDPSLLGGPPMGRAWHAIRILWAGLSPAQRILWHPLARQRQLPPAIVFLAENLRRAARRLPPVADPLER